MDLFKPSGPSIFTTFGFGSMVVLICGAFLLAFDTGVALELARSASRLQTNPIAEPLLIPVSIAAVFALHIVGHGIMQIGHIFVSSTKFPTQTRMNTMATLFSEGTEAYWDFLRREEQKLQFSEGMFGLSVFTVFFGIALSLIDIAFFKEQWNVLLAFAFIGWASYYSIKVKCLGFSALANKSEIAGLKREISGLKGEIEGQKE